MHDIFLSSVQNELAEERRRLKKFILGDPLLGRFFDVFLFEDSPDSNDPDSKAYLRELECCSLYLGLFGKNYASRDHRGLSPTEQEFDRATESGKERLVFVIGHEDGDRDPRMQALIRKAGDQVVRRVATLLELTTEVHASLVSYLKNRGDLQQETTPESPPDLFRSGFGRSR